ncbi:MAG: stalk domain-containing protein [Clostridia bacterium]|nr:stalk domain-containing protein [Clostridia bacterium]
MKTKTIKALSLLGAGAVALSTIAISTIWADDSEITEYGLKVNALEIEKKAQTADGEVMIPLRAVFENLGYTVEWNQDEKSVSLEKGDTKIVLAIDKESYTFDESELDFDVAPYLFEDTTYASVDIITDAVGGRISIDGEIMSIIVLKNVTVNLIEDGSLTVTDTEIGEVVLHVWEETQIVRDNLPAALGDIKEGDVINVLYSPAMTMSLPPQTTALIIELEPSASDDGVELQTVELTGTIESADEDDSVLLNSDGTTYRLIISDETNIHHAKNKMRYTAADLEEGMTVSAIVSSAMTRSIPAQCAAYEIVISE